MALEDRSADVRKGANEAVLPYMIHIGYEGMMKHISKVKVSLPGVLDCMFSVCSVGDGEKKCWVQVHKESLCEVERLKK